MLPSALYLRHTNGDPIGPLSLTAVEVLFDNRVVDAKTPISFDGDRFAAIEEWPEVMRRLEKIKQRLNEGEAVWGKEDAKASPRAAPAQPPPPSETAQASIERASESTVVGRMLRLAVRKQTGRLRFSGKAGRLTFAYKDGKITAVETDVPDLAVADYLERKKVVDPAALEEAAQVAPNMGGDIGGALIALQKVEPHVYFEHYLAWAKQVLGAAVAREFGEVAFEEGEVPNPPFPLGFDRLGVPVEAVRAGLRWGVASERLLPKRPCPLIISQVEGVTLDEVKLKPKELRALKRVDGVRTLGDLIDELGGSEDKSLPILQAIFFAEQAGFVAFGEDPLTRKEVAEAQEVRALLKRLEEKNYFEVLEVSEASSDDEVRARYADYAKKYHPDKIRKEAAPELLEARQKLFALVSEAATALETEDQRYKYAHDLEQGNVGGTADLEKVQASLQAETLFKKAEILLKVRKYDEAIEQIDEAITLAPDDTEFKILRVYLGHLRAAKGAEDPKPTAEKATKKILGLMKNDANIASGYLYLGHLQKALEKDDLALKYYEKVLEYDEHHPEATSQVRVLRMRKDKRKKKKRWGL